jgi:hypothetical protein
VLNRLTVYSLATFVTATRKTTKVHRLIDFFSEIKCHMIYPLPYTAVVCPTGRIFGSSCEFTCDNGTALNGPAHAQCDKTGEIVPYGRWTFMNNQPYCESTQFLDIK